MKRFFQITLFSLSFLLLAAAAQAEPRGPHGPQDFDGDGQISRTEFDQWADEMFTNLDANEDGFISEDERPERRGPRGGRGHGGPPPGLAGRVLFHGANGNDDAMVDAAEWQAFLSDLQLNDDGTVSAESLQALLPPHPRGEEPEVDEGEGPRGRRGHIAGRLFDVDHDGAVTVDDLNDLFAALDANTDGVLAEDELPTRPRGEGGRGRGPREGRFGS